MSDDFDYEEEYKRIKNEFEPHNLSQKMCKSIEKQTDIREALNGLIKYSLKSDIETQEIIKGIIYKHWKVWLPIAGVTLLHIVCACISAGWFNKH